MNNNRFYLQIYLKDLTNNLKESIILFIVIVFASTLLSLTLFLFDNSYIEKQLLESIPIEYKISNRDLIINPKKTSNLSGNSDNDSMLENYKNYFETFILALEELCESKNIKSYEFNLVQNFMYDHKIDTEHSGLATEAKNLKLFSINSLDFIDDHHLEIVAGEVEDIYHVSNGIITSSRQLISDKDGENRKIEVGDQIQIDWIYGGKTIEFEVVAIYKSKKVFDFSYGEDDLFINSNGGLIMESDMLGLLYENPQIYYSAKLSNSPLYSFIPISVNAISFICRDIESSKLFEKELESFKHDMDMYSHSSRMPNYNIRIIYPEYTSVLNSIIRIRSIYILIFSAIVLMLVFLFYSLMSYCQNKRKKEIFIYESLGKQREKIYVWYIIFYLVIILPASFVGCAPGTYLSNLVNKSILDTSIRMEKELFRYSNNGRSIEIISNSLSFPLPSIMRVLGVSLICVTVIALFISFFCYITTRTILSDCSQNVLRGGD